MMELTYDGHVIRASSMFAQDFFLAWGGTPANYLDNWGLTDQPPVFKTKLQDFTMVKAETDFVSASDKVDLLSILQINQGGAVYNLTDHYVLNYDTGVPEIVWTTDDKPAIGETLTCVGKYSFDRPTQLLKEFGRQRVTRKIYVLPDEQGEFIANSGRWSASPENEPTPHIYIEFRFDHTSAAGETIRQLGLYVNSIPNADLPIGQLYFLPGQLEDNGKLFYGENVIPYPRIVGKTEINTYVITF